MNCCIRRAIAVAALSTAGVCWGGASAQTAINLTIASSHSPAFIPVGVMAGSFKDEVDRHLKAAGGKYRINWKEAYGGTLYKLQDTMEAVRDGITDIGWVGTLWESDTMPLSNITYFTPFTTGNMKLQATVMDRLIRTVPAMKKEWEDNNMVYLGPSVSETYHLWTNFPISSLGDLKGRKINAPGAAARWLQGTHAVAVDGGLTTYYTNVQTGVTEGALSYYTGILGTRLYEVAPHITQVDLGSMFVGGIAINKDRFEKLPADVRVAIMKAGESYGASVVEVNTARFHNAQKTMEEKGAKVSTLSDEERQKWIAALPNLGAEWVNANAAKGLPAREVMQAYMQAIRDAGEKPGREWDR